MKIIFHYIVIVFVLVSVAITTSSYNSNVDSVIPDFSLRNVDGKIVSTTDYKNAKGFIVIFTCNHCPFAKLYTKRMNELSSKYSALNVPLIAINSMDSIIYEDESYSKMKAKSIKDSFQFPYLQDASQTVGKEFGAEHTPTAYVIWKDENQWKIKYKGAIDDNGENPSKANPFIGNAVDELLNNKPVTNPITESFGCRIFYRD
jgi:peroxiredoxin